MIIILLVPTYCEINICSKREISGNASQIPKLMKKFTEVVSKNFRFFLRGETPVFLPEDCHWPVLLKSPFLHWRSMIYIYAYSNSLGCGGQLKKGGELQVKIATTLQLLGY